ncbi:glycosyltransferase family 2 protein [Ferroacidibacillus organovorans]|nr:glycosyltransferase family 2 protein [Ferroacidibacillus organovorans]
MPERVTILIPTYNRPRMLLECVRAIAADPYPAKEILIINDAGSPISDALHHLSSGMSVRCIEQPVNRGHVHARNTGLREATGDYIMFCDDDDILLPGHVTRMMRQMREGGDALLFSDAEIVHYAHADGGRKMRSRHRFAFDLDPFLLRRWNTIIPSGVVYPRTFHDTLGAYDEDMRDYWDWDFWLRASALFPARRVPVASVLYMVGTAGENLSQCTPAMSRALTRFVDKHRLGPLPVSSFALMAQDPRLTPFLRPTRLIWDGSL